MFVVGVDEKEVEGHWRRPAPASRLDAEAPWGDPTVCATLCTCAGCGACAQRAASVRSPRSPASTEGVGEGPGGQGVGCPLSFQEAASVCLSPFAFTWGHVQVDEGVCHTPPQDMTCREPISVIIKGTVTASPLELLCARALR